MAHNHEVGGSGIGGGENHPHNFTLGEAQVLFRTHLLVSPEYRLIHGWHLSNAGYAVLPAPEGDEVHALIEER
jgi:hypothetical protein